MRFDRPSLLAGIVFLSTLGLAAASCGGSKASSGSGASASTMSGSTSSGAGGAKTTSSGAGGNLGTGGGIHLPDSGGACSSDSACDGGVCIHGACCAATNACGSECCGGSTVCLNEACVTPGADCYTAGDCAAGQYCETALGSGADGGVPEAGTSDAGACTQPLPRGGRCLPLPPVCPDGGTPGPDAGCVADCQYHPTFNKTLNPVQEWQWGPTAVEQPQFTDIWSTPVVGRAFDTNCDGKINELDAPVIIFVAGDDFDNADAGSNCQGAVETPSGPSMCHTGALRMINGATGAEIWTSPKIPGSVGWAGTSVAIGDVDGDGLIDIVAVTGEGNIVLLDGNGVVKRISNVPVPGDASVAFGWGGGVALADMDGDGFPEIAFGASVFTTKNGAITLAFTGTGGVGGGTITEAMPTFVDLDLAPDHHLELLAGNTAYTSTGTILWQRKDLPDGFNGVGDFNNDGKPEVVLVGPVSNGTANQANVWVLDGATGATVAGPVVLPTTVHASNGGPPTIADFLGKGDGSREIGIATADYYWMVQPNLTTKAIEVVWNVPNHDYSSSVTGSTVFDFEGEGHPAVIYADECFLWVLDGATGDVRFAAPHTSFTGTEASIVADLAGDGRAHILMVSNGADPSPKGWNCFAPDADGGLVGATIHGVQWTPNVTTGPTGVSNQGYRGLVSFGDSAHAWVGTRTLWSEHTYHVSNICDDRDSACGPPNVYGSIPTVEATNWSKPWLNNFRQNVQDKGIFDAPDAVVSLAVSCVPFQLTVSVRNIGLASLPAGVQVNLYAGTTTNGTPIGQVVTTQSLFPGQTQQLVFSPTSGSGSGTYIAQIHNDPKMPSFTECVTTNDTSPPATGACSQ